MERSILQLLPCGTGGTVEEPTMTRHASSEPGTTRVVWDAGRRLNRPTFPSTVEEDRGSPFGPRIRRVPVSPELAELTGIDITLGNRRAA